MTKGVQGAADQFEYSLSWVAARRAALNVFPDRIECGDWVIPFCDIIESTLFETRQWFIKCYILKIKTDAKTYQFGLNGNKFWQGDLPFDVERLSGRLKYSRYSIVVRAMFVMGIVWYIFFRNR